MTWTKEREQALVAEARQGGRAAFRQLYDHYLPIVHARVCAQVPLADAEDVTQEVFISVARSVAGFRGKAAFSTWMYSIVKRRVADYYRRSSRQVPQTSLADDYDVPAENPVGAVDKVLFIKRVLHDLSEQQREVIMLRLVEGLPFDQVAARLGIKLGAAKVRFYRAIQASKEQMVALEGEGVTSAAPQATKEVREYD